MESNTKWAIILCTAVLIGWAFLMPKQTKPETPKPAAVTQNVESASVSAPVVTVPAVTVKAAKNVEELNFTFNTEVAKISFSNKGGDITGYELVKHSDKEKPFTTEEGKTSFKGVEMVNNGSASKENTAFSITLDKNSYITDNFSVACSPKFASMVEGDFPAKNIAKTEEGDESIWVQFTQSFVNDGKDYSVTKTYTFDTADYMFKLDVAFDGNVPSSYMIKTSPQIGPEFNIKDRYDYRRVVYYNADDKDEDETFSEKGIKTLEDDWNYVGVAGKYFEMVIYPESKPGKTVSYRLVKNVEDESKVSNEIFMQSSSAKDTYYIYVGPREESELTKYNKSEKNIWKLSGVKLDYTMPSSGFLSWLQTILKWIMELFYKLIPNWGVSIILLTILLKIALFPLTKKSLEGNKKMQLLQPKIEEIKKKYGNNPQKQQQKTMELYKEAGYNPLSGCLPLIFQFLVLWSMYQLFYNYFEFRGASFIPGWVDDLSKGDTVYVFEGSYPVIGNTFRILPIIYLVSQLCYGIVTQNGGTATGSGMNMKIMMYGMPIMFFLLFYSAPAGLLLYWTVSNIFQLVQQIIVNKTILKKAEK